MAISKQRRNKLKLEEYLKKLELAKNATTVDPYESKDMQEARKLRAANDVEYMVNTYLPHYATSKSAQFQITFANMVGENPLFKGFAQWGRGLAKSVWGNVIIPLHLWIRCKMSLSLDDFVFFCLMSDSKERAEELLCDIQAELEGNALLIHDFGKQKSEGDWEVGNFKTIDQRFIGMAFGIKKKVRGIRVKQRRPNLWGVDDLETPDTIQNPKRMRKQADIIERDVIPTMTGKERRLMYLNNRFARIMTQTILQERHPHWVVQEIKAYNKATYKPAWGAMYTAGYYREQERDMGVLAAHAEYLHECRLEGKIFKEDDIQWCKLPDLNDFKIIVAHWDIAYTDNEKSDYNAIRVWGLKNHNRYLIACYVRQSKMRLAVDWLCQFKKTLPDGVNIICQYESQFWNGEVQRNIDESEEANGVFLNLMKVQSKGNKLGRIVTMQPYYQNGRLYYNEQLKSNHDTQIGIIQLCATEEGNTEHDDAPDADQQALAALEKYDTPAAKNNGGKSFKTGKMKRIHQQP